MGSLSPRAPVLRTLSPLDYQGLVATGVVLATVLGLLMQEPLADAECRRSALAAQERFGFVAGEVIRHEFPMFMIAGITLGGIFERAGLRPGDVPMAHHDGMAEFCYAL